MSKAIKENYLTRENGCSVSEVSCEKEKAGAGACNILVDNSKLLWVIDEPLPQYCIIDTSNLKNYPKVFNRIGFYCWHEYESNPELIEVAYASRDDGHWTIAGKIRLALSSDRQYFKIKDIPVTEMKLLRLTLLKNHGDKITFLNQVELGYVKEAQAEGTREKTFSEYVKLTSTERELKRANQQIKGMKAEQDSLRLTVGKQSELIGKVQEEVKLLLKHNERMLKMQELQTSRILQLERKMGRQKENRESRENLGNRESRERRRERPVDIVDSSDEEKGVGRGYIEDELMQRRTVPSKPNKSMSYNKGSKYSVAKGKQDYSRSKRESLLKSREAKESDNNLSEYDSSNNERSFQSEKCTQLVQKLQRLLAQKEKRVRDHTRKSQHRDQ